MQIKGDQIGFIRSVLKECGQIVEGLSEASEDFDTNQKYENLLTDIDQALETLIEK